MYQGPIIWPQNYYPQGGGQIIGQPQLIIPSNQVPAVGIPIAQPVPQAPKVRQSGEQQSSATEQAALNTEKIEVLEKLLEKYKAIATEKQNDSQALVLLKQNNADLTEQMSALTQANDQALKQVQMLEKQLAANKQNPDKMRTVGQLEDSLRSAVAQVNELKQQVETLSIDNEKLLANQSDKTELVKKNQQLAGDNEKLNQRNEALTQTSEQLTQKHAVLEKKHQELKRKTQDDVQSLEERIAKLTLVTKTMPLKLQHSIQQHRLQFRRPAFPCQTLNCPRLKLEFHDSANKTANLPKAIQTSKTKINHSLVSSQISRSNMMQQPIAVLRIRSVQHRRPWQHSLRRILRMKRTRAGEF